MWLPAASVLALKLQLYGELVSVAITAPSSENTTRLTPFESDALAAQFTVPLTVEPLAGAVMETVGGVLVVGGGVLGVPPLFSMRMLRVSVSVAPALS